VLLDLHMSTLDLSLINSSSKIGGGIGSRGKEMCVPICSTKTKHK
jgi:hypothetical protein